MGNQCCGGRDGLQERLEAVQSISREAAGAGSPGSGAGAGGAGAVQRGRLKLRNLEFLRGADGCGLLVKSNGQEVMIDALAASGPGGVIGLYFCAQWSSTCQDFSGVLAGCYQALKSAGKPFEVVCVSWDKDKDAFAEQFASMPWLAIPFRERGLAKELNAILGVMEIPALVLLQPDGAVITTDGWKAIGFGHEFFPWGLEDMRRGEARKTEAAKPEQNTRLGEASKIQAGKAEQDARNGEVGKVPVLEAKQDAGLGEAGKIEAVKAEQDVMNGEVGKVPVLEAKQDAGLGEAGKIEAVKPEQDTKRVEADKVQAPEPEEGTARAQADEVRAAEPEEGAARGEAAGEVQAPKAEAPDAEGQHQGGGPFLRRLCGPTVPAQLEPGKREVDFTKLVTMGAPNCVATRGVIYYEVELLKVEGAAQLGFATKLCKAAPQEGDAWRTGDDDQSWSVDGTSGTRRHGDGLEWSCSWAAGDVIGLAANVDSGKIAVSKNGRWLSERWGVVFLSDKIKAGVYPCLSAESCRIRVNLDGVTHGAYRHGPPPEQVWDLLHRLGRPSEAEPLLRQALQAGEQRALGAERPQTLIAVLSLALLLDAEEDRRPEAEPLFRRALEATERAFSDAGPMEAVWQTVAALLVEGGRASEARRYHEGGHAHAHGHGLEEAHHLKPGGGTPGGSPKKPGTPGGTPKKPR